MPDQSNVPDLWPDDLQAVDVTPPATILRALASQLAMRTKGVLEGQVTSKLTSNRFQHSFSIVATSLGSYRYQLLSVVHDVKLYPASLSPEQGRGWEHYDDEDALKEGLRQRLASPETRRVIGALLAQSQNPDDFPRPENDLPF